MNEAPSLANEPSSWSRADGALAQMPVIAGAQPYDPDREALLFAEISTVVNADNVSVHSRIRRVRELLAVLDT